MIRFSAISWLFLAFLFVGTSAGKAHCRGIRAGKGDFNYDKESSSGPVHWGDIHMSYRQCGLGREQSPFDVDTSKFSHKPGPQIRFEYAELHYVPTPTNFEFDCEVTETCGGMHFNGQRYYLDQVHFHHSSEHRLNGKRYPLEAHFYHTPHDGSDIKAVLAVLFKLGQRNNEIDGFLGAATHKSKRHVPLQNFVRHKPTLCVTAGSLTTPPCSEGVTWFISTKVLTVSKSQLKKFACMLGGHKNNRPLHPANKRDVTCYKSTH